MQPGKIGDHHQAGMDFCLSKLVDIREGCAGGGKTRGAGSLIGDHQLVADQIQNLNPPCVQFNVRTDIAGNDLFNQGDFLDLRESLPARIAPL